MIEARIAPSNPIVFVLDPSNGAIDVPAYTSGEIIASNPTCVSVGIRADVDGETVIELARRVRGDDQNLRKVFEGDLATPGRKIAVVTAEFESVVEQAVGGEKSSVQVWVDDEKYPGRVLVVAV